MPSDFDEQSESPEPTPEDWKRAAVELNPPPTNDYPTALVVWMVINAGAAVIVAAVFLLAWLLKP